MIFPAPRTVTAVTFESRPPSRGSSRGPVTPMADGGASGPAQGGAGGGERLGASGGQKGRWASGPGGRRRPGVGARGLTCCRRGNNDVQQSGPLSVWVAGDGAGQGGAGRAGIRRGGVGAEEGPEGAAGRDRAWMGGTGPGWDRPHFCHARPWPGPAWAARPARAALSTQSACDGVEWFKFCYLSAECA